MKRYTLYLGIATALVASCSTQEKDIQTPGQDNAVFYATFERPAEEGTRVYANENLLLRWTANDRVSIFNKITYNREYKFLGETGDNAGGFNRVDNTESVTGNPIPHVVSVYPYQAATSITEEEVVSLTLPAEQHYAENTFGLGANTMVSVSEDDILQYKNVGGFLMLKLYGEDVSVSSITLKGNNGEKLAGKATVSMPINGVPTAVMSDNASTEIILTCPTPVRLGATAEESTPFWIVVPPVTFSEGFSVTVMKASGIVFEKTTSKSISIERNAISKMSPMEIPSDLDLVPDAVDLGLPSGLKWASFNLGASWPEDYGDYYAWAETEPYYSSQDPLIWKEGKENGYAWASYKWSMDTYLTMTKYCTSSDFGYNGFIDGKTALDPEDDAVHVNLGGNWRMPTDAEWAELRENCTWTWTTQNGIAGSLVTAGNGNSIFLPAAGYWYCTDLRNAGSVGYYRSSSLSPTGPNDAEDVIFYSDGVSAYLGSRSYGFSVRPVYKEPSIMPEISVPEAIDLGLPSGLEWASFNLGASKPEEYGDYYAWGETEPYYSSQDPLIWKVGKGKGYAWASYKWCYGTSDTLIKYCNDSSYGFEGFTDTKTVLDPEDDAAHVNLGDSWRMPTEAEWTELQENCTWTWTTQNGVDGRLITGPNGNSIFLPATGWREAVYLSYKGALGTYWSSSLYTDGSSSSGAWYIFLAPANFFIGTFMRTNGCSIRPVSESDRIAVTSVSLDKTSLSLTVDETATLTATVSPDNATDKTVTWSSSNTSVATVSNNGLVTAVAEGSATITARAGDASATCSVSVTKQSVPNAISVKYYGCQVFSDHTDIDIYADNQLVSVTGWGVSTLMMNWASATAVISGVSYPLEASNGASYEDTTNHGKYYWIWAFKNTTVSNALSSASAAQPVTIIMTDVQGGAYYFVFTEKQTRSYSYYPYTGSGG